MLTDYIKNLKY